MPLVTLNKVRAKVVAISWVDAKSVTDKEAMKEVEGVDSDLVVMLEVMVAPRVVVLREKMLDSTPSGFTRNQNIMDMSPNSQAAKPCTNHTVLQKLALVSINIFLTISSINS